VRSACHRRHRWPAPDRHRCDIAGGDPLTKQTTLRSPAEPAPGHTKVHLDLSTSVIDLGAWRWNVATREIVRDAAMNRMLGLDPAALRQMPGDYLDRIHPDDVAAARAEFDRAVRQRSPYSMEYRIIGPDGSVRWLRGRGRPSYTESGALESITGVAIDVTGPRTAEAALRASEERLAAAGGSLAVHDHVHVEHQEDQAPPDRPGSERIVLDRADRTLSEDSGRATPVASASRIADPRHRRPLPVSRDVSDRRRAEDALERTEAKYRELVENANDIIFTVDKEGFCLSMNRAGQAIGGYLADTPRRTHLTHLVVPEQADFVQRQVQSVLDGVDVPVLEIEVHNKEGARITLEAEVRPISDGGSIVAVQAIARDVTARKELEQQRRQAQKMDAVGKLAAGVAHDFNNLLTIILGNCEVATPLLDGQDRLKQTIKDIRTAAERAASLTGQLLAFSRRQIIQP
jgi:PAS domain S-box-containing protein